MPSVADLINWKNKMQRMSASDRNASFTESIAWLESDQRPKCKPEHVAHLVNFENALQQQLNQQKISDPWYTTTGQTYASFPFFDAYLRRVLK